MTGTFSANQGSFQRACVPVGCSMLCVLATCDITKRWLAVETSDISATFLATILSRCESLVQTGLKRESDNKRNKTRVGAKTFLQSLMLQLAWFPNVAYNCKSLALVNEVGKFSCPSKLWWASTLHCERTTGMSLRKLILSIRTAYLRETKIDDGYFYSVTKWDSQAKE